MTKQLPGELAVCHGAAMAWGRLLTGQKAATEELLFPDRKIKIPGEIMPIPQKELFLVKGRLTKCMSDLHTLMPCRQNVVAWAKCPDLINGVLFAVMYSDYQMKMVQRSAIQSTIIKSLRNSPLSSILAFKL